MEKVLDSTRIKETSTIEKNSNGLYDLRITAPGGVVVLEVHNIRLERCLELMKARYEGARR
jgi:hypothetical protein